MFANCDCNQIAEWLHFPPLIDHSLPSPLLQNAKSRSIAALTTIVETSPWAATAYTDKGVDPGTT